MAPFRCLRAKFTVAFVTGGGGKVGSDGFYISDSCSSGKGAYSFPVKSLQAVVENLHTVDGIENHFISFDEILDHVKMMGRGTVTSSTDISFAADDTFSDCRIFFVSGNKVGVPKLSSNGGKGGRNTQLRQYHKLV